jgi:hypothetical protein
MRALSLADLFRALMAGQMEYFVAAPVSTAGSTADCRQTAELVNTGVVILSDLVSRRFPLCDAVTAFAAAENRKSLKIVLGHSHTKVGLVGRGKAPDPPTPPLYAVQYSYWG